MTTRILPAVGEVGAGRVPSVVAGGLPGAGPVRAVGFFGDLRRGQAGGHA
ncbi:hypothetical protein [Streptomyces venezuelae]